MALDIIILLVVVVIIFQKLWSLLGTRANNASTPISQESAAKIFDILMKENMRHAKQKDTVNGGELKAESKTMTETEKTLSSIPLFDKDTFLNGAKRAFEKIVKAFAKADLETLKSLIEKNLFQRFEEIIKQRKDDGITAETDFIGFNSVEIIHAEIDDASNAKISVRFVSEQANVLRNSDGKVIEGDENFIQSITDVWTFERNINSTSPNWLLISTKK